MKTKREIEEKTKTIRVDMELIEVLDAIKIKVNSLTLNSFDRLGYKDASKILARKVKEAGLFEN